MTNRDGMRLRAAAVIGLAALITAATRQAPPIVAPSAPEPGTASAMPEVPAGIVGEAEAAAWWGYGHDGQASRPLKDGEAADGYMRLVRDGLPVATARTLGGPVNTLVSYCASYRNGDKDRRGTWMAPNTLATGVSIDCLPFSGTATNCKPILLVEVVYKLENGVYTPKQVVQKPRGGAACNTRTAYARFWQGYTDCYNKWGSGDYQPALFAYEVEKFNAGNYGDYLMVCSGRFHVDYFDIYEIF